MRPLSRMVGGVLSVVTALGATQVVLAEDTTSAATSSTSTQATATATAPGATNVVVQKQNSLMDNVSLTLSSDFYGMAVTDPGSSLKPSPVTGARDETAPIFTENAAILGYKVGGSNSIGLVAGVSLAPVRGNEAQFMDMQLRYTNMKLFSAGDVDFGTQVRVYVPTSEASQTNKLLTTVRWYQFAAYKIPNSRFDLLMTTYVRPYIYGDDSAVVGAANRFRLYLGPQVGYQISSKVSAWLLFEYLGTSKVGETVMDLTALTDLEPGITWNITDKISFTPYLDIKTSERVAFDTTTINANLTFSAL